MPRIYPSSSFITHAPSCSCIFIPHHAIIQQSIHLHAKHRKGNIKSERTLAQLFAQAKGPRSSDRVSRSGESLTSRDSGLCTFSLRRHSHRLSETLACSKLSWSPERPFAWKSLGESLFTSPRRGKLTWVRLTTLATVHSRNIPKIQSKPCNNTFHKLIVFVRSLA